MLNERKWLLRFLVASIILVMKTSLLALVFLSLFMLGCSNGSQDSSQSQESISPEGKSSKGVITRAVSPQEERQIQQKAESIRQRIEETAKMPDMKLPEPPKVPKPPKVPPTDVPSAP